jgi:hypothetical protein
MNERENIPFKNLFILKKKKTILLKKTILSKKSMD